MLAWIYNKTWHHWGTHVHLKSSRQSTASAIHKWRPHVAPATHLKRRKGTAQITSSLGNLKATRKQQSCQQCSPKLGSHQLANCVDEWILLGESVHVDGWSCQTSPCVCPKFNCTVTRIRGGNHWCLRRFKANKMQDRFRKLQCTSRVRCWVMEGYDWPTWCCNNTLCNMNTLFQHRDLHKQICCRDSLGHQSLTAICKVSANFVLCSVDCGTFVAKGVHSQPIVTCWSATYVLQNLHGLHKHASANMQSLHKHASLVGSCRIEWEALMDKDVRMTFAESVSSFWDIQKAQRTRRWSGSGRFNHLLGYVDRNDSVWCNGKKSNPMAESRDEHRWRNRQILGGGKEFCPNFPKLSRNIYVCQTFH